LTSVKLKDNLTGQAFNFNMCILLLFKKQMNYIIVGLGNPGEEYENTRHNTGRIAVDTLAKKIGVNEDWKEDKKIKSETVKSKLGKNTVLLIKPNTFMNKSGDAVKSLIKNKKQAETLVVVHDDLDLPLGKIKISFNKSAGGHRGVQSIIRAIKTEGFIRMRIGISPVTPSGKMKKPSGEKAVIDLILKKMKPNDLDPWKKIMKVAAEGLESIVVDGRDVATMKINSL
jgi:PTH1 family peptidyl-tRNA hydrolase